MHCIACYDRSMEVVGEEGAGAAAGGGGLAAGARGRRGGLRRGGRRAPGLGLRGEHGGGGRGEGDGEDGEGDGDLLHLHSITAGGCGGGRGSTTTTTTTGRPGLVFFFFSDELPPPRALERRGIISGSSGLLGSESRGGWPISSARRCWRRRGWRGGEFIRGGGCREREVRSVVRS